jgi:hypothetical protein
MEQMVALSATERAAMGKKGREIVKEKFDVQKILREYDLVLADI